MGEIENPLDPARDQILHPIDLFELVLVCGYRRHVPPELLGPRANPAQHGDVEGVVILSEGYSDGRLFLSACGRGDRQGNRDREAGSKNSEAGLEHASYSSSVLRA